MYLEISNPEEESEIFLEMRGSKAGKGSRREQAKSRQAIATCILVQHDKYAR